MAYKNIPPADSHYRLGTVNSKSFVGKDFPQNIWKYELNYAKHFELEMTLV